MGTMKAYMVGSFALFTVLCGVLTINAASVSDRLGLPGPVHVVVVGAFVVLAVLSGLMTLISATSTYRQ